MTTEKKTIPRALKPEDVGVSSKAVMEFLRDLECSGIEFHSFMLIRHGKVAAECFRAPYSPNRPHQCYSLSKSITSLAIGFAIDEGFLSLKTKLVDLFPEYAPKKADENLKLLDIENLISMKSGKNPFILSDKSKVDWIQEYFNCPWYAKPGEQFRYINENIYMLSACIKKVTGMNVRDFLQPRLFEPLDIDYPFWESDRNGIEAGGWGLYLKTEDIAKIMLCFAQDGVFEGKQIIPKFWVTEAPKKQSDNSFCVNRDSAAGYGYCFWRGSGSTPTYRAEGMFGQFGIVFEEYDSVLVLTSAEPRTQRIMDCIWRHFPAVFTTAKEKDSEIKNIKELLSDLPLDIAAVSRHSLLENKIDGKTIKMKKKIFQNIVDLQLSMLPHAMTFMLINKPGNIDNIVLLFEENECQLKWSERDEHNTVLCGMDGHFRYGKIRLGQIDYSVCCNAEWLSEDTLGIHIRPLEAAARRNLSLIFRANGKVIMKASSNPTIKECVAFFEDAAADLIPNKLLVKCIQKALVFLPYLIEPKQKGRVIN